MRRRHFSLLCAAALCQSLARAAAPAKTILVLGDSLSAEYGLARGSGWVALLTERLKAAKSSYAVTNASISGDTTSGGRSRLPALLQTHQPALVVIELGANDALRGLPLGMTEDNLRAMVELASKTGAKVLLLGMQLPPNYGADYGRRFADLYAKLAKSHKTGLVPFFLAGVADDPDPLRWFQADRIHPLASAHPRLLDNVWPALQKLMT